MKKTKKFISILLSTIMLFASISGLEFSVLANNTSEVFVNETKQIALSENEHSIVLKFIPKESGFYHIYSTGEYDTKISLYAETNDYYCDIDDDDSGENCNFSIKYLLKENVEYYLTCYSYDTDAKFNVKIEKLNCNNGKIELKQSISFPVENENNILVLDYVAIGKEKVYFSVYDPYSTCHLYLYDDNYKLETEKCVNDGNVTELSRYLKNGEKYYLAVVYDTEYYPYESYDVSVLNHSLISETAYNYNECGDIELNKLTDIYIDYADDNVINCYCYNFTPTKSGEYFFSSLDESDTIGYVYNSNNEIVAYDDDSGALGKNFFISCYLEAGDTYKFVCRNFYDNSGSSNTIIVSDCNLIYEENDNSVEITGYCGPAGNVDIPCSINNKPVVSIGEYAFFEKRGITSILIPSTVKTIKDEAFMMCSNLSSVILSDGLEIICFGAFQNCDSLEIITMPKTVTSIGNAVFYNCKKLNSILVDSKNTNYSSVDGVLFNNDKTTLIQYPCGKTDDSYSIPEGVSCIDRDAFAWCNNITHINVPSSLKIIGDNAFNCMYELKSICLPKGITEIGNNSFYDCVKLEQISVPDTVKRIGDWSFAYCYSLKEIIIPSNVESIGDSTFFWCDNLKSITFLNPNCNIKYLGYLWTETGKVTIYGYDGSTAQKYVENLNDKNIIFQSLEKNICEHLLLKSTVIPAKTSENGSKVTKCTVCGNQISKSTIYYPKTITLSATKYTYDGKAKKPTVTVKDSKGNKISSSNYTVKYTNNIKIGKATVKITFKGNYSGTVSKTFTIVPKTTSISSLTAASKGFTVKWKKQATQTTGYQIQIATDSGFTKGVKNYTVSKNSTVSKKITKLTGKKKYYVRIRTYKTVSGTKYYSAWSGNKTVTTKK